MAFNIVIGGDAQPDTGFNIVIGDTGGGGPTMLDFTLPAVTSGTVLLILVIRDAAVSFNGVGWTKVIDGEGASGVFLDGWAFTADGTESGDVVSVLSLTEQELQGGLVEISGSAVAGLVYDVQHGAFIADAAPSAPSIDAQAERDTIICVWSADAEVDLTAPGTEIDMYASTVAAARTLLVDERVAGAIDEIIPGSATASPAATGRAFSIAIHYAAPGVTLTAMQAGSVRTKLVCAIEGYGNLLTDADTGAVTTAWADTGYTAAIGGLYVRHSTSQEINPWNSFENTGGQLTLQVTTDSFGVDTHVKSGGFETQAKASIDCNDTSVTVKATTSFPASGTVYIGTEAMDYASKTGGGTPSFNTLTRGKYSPFLTESAADFAHPHTITGDPTTVAILPVVSSTPRTWHGKWVGLWRHLEGSSGLLNVKDDALCTFAGRITEVRDNPATMTTDVEVEHVLEYVRDAVIGENPWKATIEDGITLVASTVVPLASAIDSNGTTVKTADPLMVVSGTPASSYEVQAGRYTLTQITGFINAWFDQALDDADLYGAYKFGLTAGADGLTHGKFVYRMSTTGAVVVTLQWTVHRALGKFAGATGSEWAPQAFARNINTANQTFREASVGTALRSIGVGGAEATVIFDEFGEFYDQATSLPDNLLAMVPSGLTGSVGICMLNDADTVILTKNGATLESLSGFNPATGTQTFDVLDVPWDSPGETRLRQIYVLRDTFANIVKRLFCSTGTASFNSTFDTNPAILGLGIPYDVLGAEFFASVDRLANADQEITIVIDRPKKLIDILGAALKLRSAFLRWKSGHLEFFSWMTPTTGDALVEGNKASPAGNQDEQRSVSVLSDRWTRNVIKIDYDRDFAIADTGDATFNSHVTIIYRAGIDDAGGKRITETIQDPTSFTTGFLGGSGTLDVVIDHFKSIATMFMRPVRTSRRTIAPTFFEGIAVGDCVLVNDNYARDPDTGARGVSTRPGIIVAHSYELGGFTPTSDRPDDMHGEVEIMFLDLLRVGPYVPSANVASYTGSTITCNAHDVSTTDESADASWMSAARKIRMIERDPADPAAPLVWDRIVSSQSGNDIVLTAALSSPAYDAAKFYRVVWDDYSDAIAAQQVYAYQADDADNLISDVRAAYQYTANTGLIVFGNGDANDPADPVELPPDGSYGDGVGYDVGHMQALSRLSSNLYDYKTAASTPQLFRTLISVSGDVTHEWTLVVCMPVFLGRDGLTSTIRRELYVAPHWRSSYGASVSCRFTLSKNLPTGDSLSSVALSTPSVSYTFTTTSTTFATPTAYGINYGPFKDFMGVVYLLVEIQVPTASGSEVAELRGISTSYQGPRE